MKIRELKSKQILSLYLLKSKVYNQVTPKDVSNFSNKSYFIETLVSLKRVLQIIFQYHVKNKLILFIGLPENLRIKINKSTCHVALSKYVSFQGVISGTFKNENLFKGGKKPYLVVLVNHVNVNEVIKETYLAKIPLICINSVCHKLSLSHVNYKVSLNSDSFYSLHNLFFLGLSFLFK